MMLQRLQELRPDLHAELSRRAAECIVWRSGLAVHALW